MEDIRAQGVTDFRKYIKENPHFVSQAAQKVKITDVNEETLRLFEAKSKEEIRQIVLDSWKKIVTGEIDAKSIEIEEIESETKKDRKEKRGHHDKKKT